MNRANFWCLAEQRRLIKASLADVAGDAWFEIPLNRRNNIAWNLGHIVTVQQLLTYGLSNLELHIPKKYVKMFSRSTDPSGWTEQPHPVELLELLEELPTVTATDYEAGRFNTFKEFTTTTGVKLTNLDDAMAFNNFHEGIHHGVMLSIRRELLAARG